MWPFKKKSTRLYLMRAWVCLGTRHGRSTKINKYSTSIERIEYFRDPQSLRFEIVGIDNRDTQDPCGIVKITGRLPWRFDGKTDKQILRFLIEQYTPWVIKKRKACSPSKGVMSGGLPSKTIKRRLKKSDNN